MNLIPLLDRVIIEPLTGPEKIGGIIIPELAREKPDTGTVVAVGPGRVSDQGILIPTTVNVGDKVIFNRYSASQIELDGQKFSMIHEHEINCIINLKLKIQNLQLPKA